MEYSGNLDKSNCEKAIEIANKNIKEIEKELADKYIDKKILNGIFGGCAALFCMFGITFPILMPLNSIFMMITGLVVVGSILYKMLEKATFTRKKDFKELERQKLLIEYHLESLGEMLNVLSLGSNSNEVSETIKINSNVNTKEFWQRAQTVIKLFDKKKKFFIKMYSIGELQYVLQQMNLSHYRELIIFLIKELEKTPTENNKQNNKCKTIGTK